MIASPQGTHRSERGAARAALSAEDLAAGETPPARAHDRARRLEGGLYAPETALRLGLIDEVVAGRRRRRAPMRSESRPFRKQRTSQRSARCATACSTTGPEEERHFRESVLARVGHARAEGATGGGAIAVGHPDHLCVQRTSFGSRVLWRHCSAWSAQRTTRTPCARSVVSDAAARARNRLLGQRGVASLLHEDVDAPAARDDVRPSYAVKPVGDCLRVRRIRGRVAGLRRLHRGHVLDGLELHVHRHRDEDRRARGWHGPRRASTRPASSAGVADAAGAALAAGERPRGQWATESPRRGPRAARSCRRRGSTSRGRRRRPRMMGRF